MIARTSPFETVWRDRAAGHAFYSGMRLPSACGDESSDRRKLARLGVVDVSAAARAVVKGAGAREAIAARDWPTPDRWFLPEAIDGWRFVARTGANEFVVEGAVDQDCEAQGDVAAMLTTSAARAYTKEDGSLLLCGDALQDALAEVLTVPLSRLTGQLVYTQLAAVTASLWERSLASLPCVQIWADATYCAYLGRVLLELATERGGGWVGLAAISAAGLSSWEKPVERMP